MTETSLMILGTVLGAGQLISTSYHLAKLWAPSNLTRKLRCWKGREGKGQAVGTIQEGVSPTE